MVWKLIRIAMEVAICVSPDCILTKSKVLTNLIIRDLKN